MARRPNAYTTLIHEGSPATEAHEGEKQDVANTVKLQNCNTVKSDDTVKLTFYPTRQNIEKLYDLMDAHRKKTGARINQQDLLRRLIELADINTLLP